MNGDNLNDIDALGRRAVTALHRDVDRRIDVDAALRAVLEAEHTARPAVHLPMTNRTSRRPGRVWLGAAAAVALVAAGAVVYAATREGASRVVPADSTIAVDIDIATTSEATAPEPTPVTATTEPATTPPTSPPAPTTSAPPPATEVDALAGLVAPSPIDPVEVPAFLPSTPVAERSQVQLRQFSEPVESVSRLVQTWAGAGRILSVTTSFAGEPLLPFESLDAFGYEFSPVSIWPWDEGAIASAISTEEVQLRDPSGNVSLLGIGFTPEELVAIASDMTMTPNGWALASTADAGLIELHSGWIRTTYATRILQWDTGNVRGEVMVTLGAPGAILSVNDETPTEPVDVRGAPALVTTLPTGTAVSWSPRPDVVVVLGYTGTVDEALALARSLEPVDEATWLAAGADVTSSADGCDSYFFC